MYYSFLGIKPCGYITPESPAVRSGSNFTAICVLAEECMKEYEVSANDIFWKQKHAVVPNEQCTIINRTASSVRFINVSSNFPLTCNFQAFGQINLTAYGIQVTTGCKFSDCFISDFAMPPELYF